MRLAGANIFRRRRPNFTAGNHYRRFSTSFSEHVSFIKDVAATSCPEHLPNLLNMLQKRENVPENIFGVEQVNLAYLGRLRVSKFVYGALGASFCRLAISGEFIISPCDKQGLFPFAIPLSRNTSGVTISLLRWPTIQSGMDMPVVEVHKYGVSPLAKNVDQYIHRLLVEEDASITEGRVRELFRASDNAGTKLYKEGDFTESQMQNLDTYLLRKVGVFPDVVERKINQYLDKGNHMSALVTGEFYTKKQHFPGFGRPAAFNAKILRKVGHPAEAREAARAALKSPWWSLGYRYQEVAEIAEWKDEQIYYIKNKLTQEEKQEELNKGKELRQIALDEVAYLLDLASVEGTWDDFVDRIAECYKDARLSAMARFISYKG